MNTTRMRRAPKWDVSKVTVSLVIRGYGTTNQELLLVDKLEGIIVGKTTEPGGVVESTDKNVVSAANRELFEEMNLIAHDAEKFAEVTIRIRDKRREIILHAIRCLSWTGELKNKDPKLANERFEMILNLPYALMPGGDEQWLRPVVEEGLYCKAYIYCGNDRNDVLKKPIVRTYKKSPF
ncbi:MAG: NUDIX domain-containing protein [Candidatus Taylorbacteria bacterium]|nr:NUDIX domain-containing protein [Candidatus Taylorbacteria bacterium]